MARRASNPLHLLARLLGMALAALLLAATAALWWVGQTTSFVRWALDRVEVASAGALEVGAVRGTLAGGFGVASLRWRDGLREIELRDVSVAWRADGLVRRELHVTRLEIGSALVRLGGPDVPMALPASLKLPIDVSLDALGLGQLLVESVGSEPVALERIGLAGRYRDGAYRIDHLSARSPKWGEATLQGGFGDLAPFAFEASAQVGPQPAQWGALPHIRLLADGTFEDFALAAQAIAPAGTQAPAGARGLRPVWIGMDTRVRPLTGSVSQWLAPIELSFDGVEPGQLGFADAPRARVSGTATIRVAEARLTGRLALRNALAGAADRQALPVSAIETEFAWSGNRLVLDALRAALPGGGSVAGKASIDLARRMDLFGRSLPRLEARLSLGDLDLSRIVSGLPATRLTGLADASDAAVSVELIDASRRNIAVSVRARVDDGLLRIDRAELGTPGGRLSTRGTASLAAPWRVDLSGEFRELDPSGVIALRSVLGGAAPAIDAQWPPGWASRLSGKLSGNWAAQGVVWPDPQLRVRVAADRGALDEQTFRASFEGELSRERMAGVTLELALGDLHASAQGSLGRAGDRLRFSARTTSLARLDRRLEGSMSARGELVSGPPVRAGADGVIGIVADIEGRSLRWANAVRADAVRAEAAGPQVAGWRIDRARVRIEGEEGAHVLRLEVSDPQLAVRASARGALAHAGGLDWRWEGSIDELVADAAVPVRLERPVRLVADSHGAVLGEMVLQVDGGIARVAAFGWRDGHLETQGEASGLPIARWAARLAGPQAILGAEGELQDLRMRASWNLAGASLQSLSGRLGLQLDAGDAVESGGEADLTLDEGRLDGAIDLRIPTLAFANRLIGPEWAVAGRLRFAGSVGGTIARPRLQGELTGRNLTLLQRALGWRLAGGTLDARFDGDRLNLQMLRLESGGGSISMNGQLLLDGMHGGFTLRAERLPVPIGPGERVVVSGVTGVASSGASLEWKGDIRADEGLIELRGGDAPSLPEDVVVIDRRAAGEDVNPVAVPPASGFRIGADLNLDLGDRLRVRGGGVDVVLAGVLNLRGTLPAAPRGYGTVRVRQGTYNAYGQRLEIERGQVVFNGPLDNPVLDIVAVRRNQAVEAGVALSGTVLSPRLRLVSKPDVPDSQKLSWLVLGVGLDDVRTAGQSAALQAAAATLFGSNDGGLSAGLAGALGLDILTVRGAGAGAVFDPNFGASFPGQATTGGVPVGTAAQNVVAIGKRLSSRVFLTYEQGLRGVWNLLRIQYDISNRLSIRAQAGTDSAVDVLYFWLFD